MARRCESAEEQRQRLFDHIPAPPPELFETIETPLEGPVPLWAEIPVGTFRMGSPEHEEGRFDREGPAHKVTIQAPFRLGVVPVTNAQFATFDPKHKPRHWEGVAQGELAYHPVENVTWFEAMVFCRWLSMSFSERFGGARLPTEEEWEYACRAGTQTRYWRGDQEGDLAEVGWYDENTDYRTHRVGENLPTNGGSTTSTATFGNGL